MGLLLGASLAFGLRAPNPVLGWGTMAAGVVVGVGAGVALAKLAPPALDAVLGPAEVALVPLVVPPRRDEEPPLGVGLSVALR